MKLFSLIFFCYAFIIINASLAATVTLYYDGTGYEVTYNTTTFTASESDINTSVWWTGGGVQSKKMADNSGINGLRFAYDKFLIGGNNYAAFKVRENNDSNLELVSQSANYAISAVTVPGPLPFLGLLPVISFLRKMRRVQQLR